MFHKISSLLAPLMVALSLSGFSAPFSAAAESEGNPWWIWIIIFFALAAFVAFVLWWWMRSHDEEEEEVHEPHRAVAPVPVAEVEEPVAMETPVLLVPDDLKRVEGIGPKISSVLQAGGIATFAQLADASVDQIRQVLEEADPNLLRLADPTSWPEQARLAADGDWEALEKLHGELKGGRRA